MKNWSEIPIESVLPGFEWEAFTKKDFEQRIQHKASFPSVIRETLTTVIRAQYDGLILSPSADFNITSLRQANTYTICTGQQIVSIGGPWMILLKIATAIQQARYWNQQLPQAHFVPVFWMATEDHDFAEIANVNNGIHKFQWNTTRKGAVGRMPTDEMVEAFTRWNQTYPEWLITDEILNLYKKSASLSEATRRLIHQVFGQTELLILDPDNPQLKSFFIPVMKKELTENASFEVMSAKGQIDGEVEVKKGNLFYLGDQDRKRIEWADSQHNPKWISLLDEHPQDFSPGVVLRPLYQEIILPNVMYVGGPSECRYWNQLKPLLEEELGIAPLILLRERAWVIPEKIIKKWEKANWTMDHWTWSAEEWNQFWKERWDPFPDPDEQKRLLDLLSSWEAQVAKEDSTLAPMIAAEKKKWMNSLDMIQAKVLKSRKQRDEVEGAWFHQWQQSAYPLNQLQERQLFWIWDWSSQKIEVETLLQRIEPEKKTYKIWQV